ncbi:hypothetical protein N3K66_003206 [Trichothecium roseum]|uniref:Uncharacterized protein n=1 Tax=Trichothecium roseum TaxID=47278 RepID=A0ACC0V4M2_9HYPO|nr:hypothetical protein N3K66_003206 [Trichothecium roseum]
MAPHVAENDPSSSSSQATISTTATPIFLLKTASAPTDAYADLLAASGFAPTFVPVLRHSFNPAGLDRIRSVLGGGDDGISARPGSAFGGLIFTSQRAVEAFSKAVEEGGPGGDGGTWPAQEQLGDVPVYSVGPATTRALRAVPAPRPLQIFGEHTGNGAALSTYILDHYNAWYPPSARASPHDSSPPLLFLVGEQHRDIIPKTLMDPSLPPDRRVPLTEQVVYGTGVMESFPLDLDAALRRTAGSAERWVAVFSPTGCDSMLRGLGLLDEATGRARSKGAAATAGGEGGDAGEGAVFVVTIGPTTQAHLREGFGFEPHAMAEVPSPEGVLEAINRFREGRR